MVMRDGLFIQENDTKAATILSNPKIRKQIGDDIIMHLENNFFSEELDIILNYLKEKPLDASKLVELIKMIGKNKTIELIENPNILNGIKITYFRLIFKKAINQLF